MKRTYRGSFTVEASLVMLLVLFSLAAMIRLSFRLYDTVRDRAALWEAEEKERYHTGIQPVELIRIGQFIAEWIPDNTEE